MGKKDSNVKLKRNGVEKSIPKNQWDAMKKSGNTYGWHLASEVSKDTLKKEGQVENNQIKELTSKVEGLEKKNGDLQKKVDGYATENSDLKETITGKDNQIKELQSNIDGLEALKKEQADLLAEHVKGTPKSEVKAKDDSKKSK